jgi:hypothetical protein
MAVHIFKFFALFLALRHTCEEKRHTQQLLKSLEELAKTPFENSKNTE